MFILGNTASATRISWACMTQLEKALHPSAGPPKPHQREYFIVTNHQCRFYDFSKCPDSLPLFHPLVRCKDPENLFKPRLSPKSVIHLFGGYMCIYRWPLHTVHTVEPSRQNSNM